MLKPSFKSVEGQSVYAVIIGALVMLYDVLSGNGNNSIPVELLVEHAKTAKEIAAAYGVNDVMTSGGWDTAKVVAILAFVYKIYGRFTDSRTELKKKELDIENK